MSGHRFKQCGHHSQLEARLGLVDTGVDVVGVPLEHLDLDAVPVTGELPHLVICPASGELQLLGGHHQVGLGLPGDGLDPGVVMNLL